MRLSGLLTFPHKLNRTESDISQRCKNPGFTEHAACLESKSPFHSSRVYFKAYHLPLLEPEGWNFKTVIFRETIGGDYMRNTSLFSFLSVSLTAAALCLPATAQTQGSASTSSATIRVAAGQKQKISGVVLSREVDNLIVRDINGSDVAVSVSGGTKIVEKKSNPFRGARNYPVSALLRGLEVEIEGRGNSSGALVAEKIKFTNDDFGVARSLDTRVAPVETRVTTTEGRMDTAENRMTAAEQNAQRLSGQLEELSAVANTARGGAKAAQETADQALATAKAVSADIQAANDRISQIDNYEAKQNIAVNFKVNSAVLSDEAK